MNASLPTEPQPPDRLQPEPPTVTLGVRLFEMLDCYLNAPRYVTFVPGAIMMIVGNYYHGLIGAILGFLLFVACLSCLVDIKKYLFPNQTLARNEQRSAHKPDHPNRNGIERFVRVSAEFLPMVDKWRRQQKNPPARDEAIRLLVKTAIDRHDSDRLFGPMRADLHSVGLHWVIHLHRHPENSPYAGQPAIMINVLPDGAAPDKRQFFPTKQNWVDGCAASHLLRTVKAAHDVMEYTGSSEEDCQSHYLGVCASLGFDPNWQPKPQGNTEISLE